LYEVEIEPEVQSCLASLPDRDFGRAGLPRWPARRACRRSRRAVHTTPRGESPGIAVPSAAQQTRVSYWLAPGRRVILLTVFRKTRSAEVAEVARARRAQEICESTHGIAHEVFDREAT
jgi:hypothetical protein